MNIDEKKAAQQLLQAGHVRVISHASPDGDTLGCASALLRGLAQKGKKISFACSDPVPEKFAYLFEGISFSEGEPDFICAVDIADTQLFGKKTAIWADKVGLCIDHHGTNTGYAIHTLLDSRAAAACEIIYQVLLAMDVTITPDIAGCLFTGITTDTGCFRYGNVTPRTHEIAARLMEQGAPAADINRRMFETKTRARLEIERRALDSMEFFCEGRCAVMTILQKDMRETGATEDDLDGLPALPRQIEGVLAGVCVKEKPDGTAKVSLRTNDPLDAAVLCGRFGGGGHKAAAGCAFHANSGEEAAALARKEMVQAVQETLEACP